MSDITGLELWFYFEEETWTLVLTSLVSQNGCKAVTWHVCWTNGWTGSDWIISLKQCCLIYLISDPSNNYTVLQDSCTAGKNSHLKENQAELTGFGETFQLWLPLLSVWPFSPIPLPMHDDIRKVTGLPHCWVTFAAVSSALVNQMREPYCKSFLHDQAPSTFCFKQQALLGSILLASRIQPIPVHRVMVLVFGRLWKTQSDVDPGRLCEPHSSRSAVILKKTYISGISLGSTFWHCPGKDCGYQKSSSAIPERKAVPTEVNSVSSVPR